MILELKSLRIPVVDERMDLSEEGTLEITEANFGAVVYDLIYFARYFSFGTRRKNSKEFYRLAYRVLGEFSETFLEDEVL